MIVDQKIIGRLHWRAHSVSCCQGVGNWRWRVAHVLCRLAIQSPRALRAACAVHKGARSPPRADVRFWHKADKAAAPEFVRFCPKADQVEFLAWGRLSAFDPEPILPPQ